MSDKKEVTIKLTDDQRRQVKEATGKDIAELKVGTVDDRANPLVAEELTARANPLKVAEGIDSRANPLQVSDAEARANPFAISEETNRANPFAISEETNRANPMAIGEDKL